MSFLYLNNDNTGDDIAKLLIKVFRNRIRTQLICRPYDRHFALNSNHNLRSGTKSSHFLLKIWNPIGNPHDY